MPKHQSRPQRSSSHPLGPRCERTQETANADAIRKRRADARLAADGKPTAGRRKRKAVKDKKKVKESVEKWAAKQRKRKDQS